ncbi:MAG: phosphoadenylyl-sulfate reductase [Hyphomicrobiaceae bacterium]
MRNSAEGRFDSGRISALNNELANIDDLQRRLHLIAQYVPGRIAFSTSMGHEDQAVLHAIAASGAAIDVFTLDTGRLFQETFDTIDASEKRYGIKIRVVAPDAKDLTDLVARDGVNGFRTSLHARKSCCSVRKVQPLNRELSGAQGWMTGLRRSQAAGRNAIDFAEAVPTQALVKLSPIADWSPEQLRDFLHDNDVPVNVLHAQGYPSIGCQSCTRAIRPGEDIRAGRWWWENEDGKECGLHTRTNKIGASL